MKDADAARWYQILDLEPGADLSQVKDSYRTLCQIWHPDKQKPGSKEYARAVKKQQELNAAYAGLKELLEARTGYGGAANSGRKAAAAGGEGPRKQAESPPPPPPEGKTYDAPSAPDLFEEQKGVQKSNFLEFLLCLRKLCNPDSYRPLGKQADTFGKPGNYKIEMLVLKLACSGLGLALLLVVFVYLPVFCFARFFGAQAAPLGFIAGLILLVLFALGVMVPTAHAADVYEYLTDPQMESFRLTPEEAENAVRSGLQKFAYASYHFAPGKTGVSADQLLVPATINFKDESGNDNRIDCRIECYWPSASQRQPVLVKVSFAAKLSGPRSYKLAAKIFAASLSSLRAELVSASNRGL